MVKKSQNLSLAKQREMYTREIKRHGKKFKSQNAW